MKIMPVVVSALLIFLGVVVTAWNVRLNAAEPSVVHVVFVYTRDHLGHQELEVMKDTSMMVLQKNTSAIKKKLNAAFAEADTAYRQKMKSDRFFREREEKKAQEKESPVKKSVPVEQPRDGEEVVVRSITTHFAGDRGNFSESDFGGKTVVKPQKVEFEMSDVFRITAADAETLQKFLDEPQDQEVVRDNIPPKLLQMIAVYRDIRKKHELN